MKIEVNAQNGKARCGTFETAHGTVETPCFMPIATAGALKGIEAHEARELGAQMLLANTYHLALRPGEELIEKAGGLHQFMGYDGPLLTDSGGFQVFSLSKIRKISEEGVEFASHLDGQRLMLTPERSIEIQMKLGADIVMAFDECKPPDSVDAVRQSVELTTRWAERSRKRFHSLCHSERSQEAIGGVAESRNLSVVQTRDSSTPLRLEDSLRVGRNDTKNGLGMTQKKQSLFGIVQGATDQTLRKKSARSLVKIDFDGYAVGGLSVGESEENMYAMLDVTVPELPEDQPRYLMGVGTPKNIIEAVARGIDMFDCVLPTRNARHGYLFTSQGMIHLRNERFREDFTALDPECDCITCTKYHKAYLRHLLLAGEILVIPLLVRHNLRYYLRLMQKIRESIREGKFEWLRKRMRDFSAQLADKPRSK